MVYGLWVPLDDAFVFVHMTAGAEFCTSLNTSKVWILGPGLYFLKDVGTVKTCIFFCLLWTPAQYEHDMIAFVGPYSWLATQFSVEGHITCWIVWWIFGSLPKMFSVFKQCCQHMCLFLDNHCSFCNCNRTSFRELLRQKLNHESLGWVTVEMVMMSAACDGGEIGRPPSKVQPTFVAPESVCLTCRCFSLSKTCRRMKRSVQVLTFLSYYLVSLQNAYL